MPPLYWQPWRNVIVDKKIRPCQLNRYLLWTWIDTIFCQRNPNITRLFFKVWPFFLHISKCKTICKHLNNVILTYVPCMVIHKLCYAIAPEQSLQIWNDWNIMKNFVRHLFCYLICSISTYMTLWTFYFKFMLFIIYNMDIGVCINCFILHSNLFHDD